MVSGDIAFSGKRDEYELANDFLRSVRTSIAHENDGAVPLFIGPGNHDCDFSGSQNVRQIVIDSLEPQHVDNSVIQQCVRVQDNFFAFLESVNASHSVPAPGLARLHASHTVQLDDRRVVVHLFNSAWTSVHHEKPGTMYFPVELLKDRFGPEGDIVLSVIHHPYNWFFPENSRSVKELLEESSDLILTGHEHVSEAYSKRSHQGEQTEYLEGGVLQES